MSNKFQTGDVVKLKCGGPRMVCTLRWTDNKYDCIWIDPSGVLRQCTVDERCLKKCWW